MAKTKGVTPTSQTIQGRTVHTVKITVVESQPLIWRRLDVPSGSTLLQLHSMIQAAFGWENYHLWAFQTSRGRYGLPDRELGLADAATIRLDQAAAHVGDRLRYTYDFGDDWEHDILVEAVTAATEPGVTYPRCLAGSRACPPEDCGGVWGYENLLEALADPSHEEHHERLEWLGLNSAGQFDPAAFDLAETNTALSNLTTNPTTTNSTIVDA